MIAIFKRDFRSLFTNVIGWVFISIICAFYGLYFLIYNLISGSPFISNALSGICFLLIIMAPILCMRIFTEERKNRTDQLIFTAPVSAFKIVFGKFLAVAATFTIVIAVIAISPIVLNLYGAEAMGQNYVALLGFYLFGLACIAISLFVSTLTKSQILSVLISFVILFFSFILDGALSLIFTDQTTVIARILNCFAIAKPYEDMMGGFFDIKSIIYYVLVIVIFLFFAYCVIQKRRWTMSKQVILRSVSRGAAIVISIVLVLGINVGVGYIPDDYTEFDATSIGIYSLSDEGKDFLKEYDKEATIYVLETESNCDQNLKKTLDNFGSYKNINVEYVDLNEEPTFASKYTTDNLNSNSLIVVSGDVSKCIDYQDIYDYSYDSSSYSQSVSGYDGEGLIVSALQSVANNNDSVIATLTGHGELELESTFTSSITKGNFRMESLDLSQAVIPDKCKLIVINGPTKDLTEDEANKLIEYYNNGGNIIATIANGDAKTGDYVASNTFTNYMKVLNAANVSVIPGIVLEGSSSNMYQEADALLPKLKESDETDNISGNVLAYRVTAIKVNDDAKTILETSDDAFIREDLDISSSASVSKGDSDSTDTYTIGTEITNDNGGSMVVLGSQFILDDQMDGYVNGNNSKLFANTVKTLTSTDDGTTSTVIIPAKSVSVEAINVTVVARWVYGILWGLAIPIMSLIAGIVIWAIRKND